MTTISDPISWMRRQIELANADFLRVQARSHIDDSIRYPAGSDPWRWHIRKAAELRRQARAIEQEAKR
jgi:hypothetical protein